MKYIIFVWNRIYIILVEIILIVIFGLGQYL